MKNLLVTGMMALSLSGAAVAADLADIPPAVEIEGAPAGTTAEVLHFLEARVKNDPEDMVALNRLSGTYLAWMRESGDISNLAKSVAAARQSLQVLPAERNLGGLAALTQAELTSHQFLAAREHAQRLAELDPGKSHAYQLLCDAYIELGDYPNAEAALKKVISLAEPASLMPVAIEQRKAKLAEAHGDMAGAKDAMVRALKLALAATRPPAETVAWIRWQLGDLAFDVGDYEIAEHHMRDALTTMPTFTRAVAALGEIQAARGDLNGAIVNYVAATKKLHDLALVSQLADIYKIAGREAEAKAEFARAVEIATANAALGGVYVRERAQFYADHDLEPELAYQLAKKDYEVRRDVGGADVLAWSALKAGHIPEAKQAMAEAMRLGTEDAKLFYHAGMIARAEGDKTSSTAQLKKALEINPKFDLLQAQIARDLLAQSTN